MSIQHRSKVSRSSTQRKTSVRSRPAAESNRNYFLLPTTKGSSADKVSMYKESADIESADIESMTTIDINSFSGEKAQSKTWQVMSTPDTFLLQKTCRCVQITLCSNWRRIMLSATNVSSEHFSKASKI